MKSFLTKIYLFRFFDDFIIIYPLYTVMFTDFGITPWQISVLFAIWSFTAIALEVPSGVLADKYSRRNLLVIGQIIRAIGYGFWLFMPTFLGFAIGFVFWSIKGALTSGTLQAIVYDKLKHHKQEQHYAKVLSMNRGLGYTAIFIASLLASFLYQYGFNLMMTLSIGAVVLSGLCLLTIPDAKPVESTGEKDFIKHFKASINIIQKNKQALFFIVILTTLFSLGGTLDEYWPIFIDEVGTDRFWLGIILAFANAVSALIGFFAYKFEKMKNGLAFTLIGLCGIGMLFGGYLFSIPAIIFLFIYSNVFEVLKVVYETKLQHAIPSKQRATISSVAGFSYEVAGIIIFLAVGAISEWFSFQTAFIGYGVVTTIAAIAFASKSMFARMTKTSKE